MYKVGVVDFAVFERGKDYLGMASVQLPTVNQKVIAYSAAGTGGDFEVPTGKIDPMSVTFNFHSVTDAATKLSTMRVHQVELRSVHQNYDPKKVAVNPEGIKYVMDIMPKSENFGQVQPASPQAVSGEYACHAFKMFIGNKLVRHVDPVKNINWDPDNGNLLAKYNKILGK